MAPNRGTDPTTERRQLREGGEKDAVGRFLEDAFDAVAAGVVVALASGGAALFPTIADAISRRVP
jgi:hypothetical protein